MINYNSKLIKETIKAWNTAYKEYKNNKTLENKINLKNIKYKTTNTIKNEETKNEINYFNDNNGNPNKIWTKAKNKLFTNENNQMDKIVHNNKLIKRSKNTC